jgi:AP-3 complex subunit delta-1
MNDFEWYIGVLVELVKQCPASSGGEKMDAASVKHTSIADSIGSELLNVAIRVKAVRPEAAAAAQSLLNIDHREQLFPAVRSGGQGVLAPAAFIAGEFAEMLPDPDGVLTSLTHSSSSQLPAAVLTNYLQAIPKVFLRLVNSQQDAWSETRQSNTILLIARMVHFIEPLTLHPSLEVQERAVEYLDLMRLSSEAVSNQQVNTGNDAYAEPPLLLTQAIPSLFSGMELNPVAPAAIHKVPKPDDLDLNAPINSNLNTILHQAEYDSEYLEADDEVYRLYHEKPSAVATDYQKPAADILEPPGASRSSSYQDSDVVENNREISEKKRAERRERFKDDPYYIDPERSSGTSTPMHSILRSTNGEELNVDDIPVMELKLDNREVVSDQERTARAKPSRKPRRHFEIAVDETLGDDDSAAFSLPSSLPKSTSKAKKSLLEVDSSGLSALSLSESANAGKTTQLDFERRQAEEEEMAKAMKEVERLRLEMQRAQERIQPGNVPEAGTVVKRKKKKKAKVELLDDAPAAEANGQDGAVVKKKKKKKRREEGDDAPEEVVEQTAESAAPVKVKKKKRRQVTFDEDGTVE